MNDKLKKLERIAEILDAQTDNSEAFVLLERVLALEDQIKLIEAKPLDFTTKEEVEGVFNILQDSLNEIKSNDKTQELEAKISQLLAEHRKLNKDKDYSDDYFNKEIQTLKNVIADIKAIKPQEIDINSIIQEVYQTVKDEVVKLIPEVKEVSPETIIEQIEERQLDVSSIKGLQEMVEKLTKDQKKTIIGANKPLSGLLDVNVAGILPNQSIKWNGQTWVAYTPGGGGGTWGSITGDLEDQTDLKDALDNKYDASNPDGFISDISGQDLSTADNSTSQFITLADVPAEADTLQTVTDRGATTTKDITAKSFIKTGGLSSEFLKADGSSDSNTYLTSFTETDPVFTAHPAYGLTSDDMTDIGNLSGTNTGDQDLSSYLTNITGESIFDLSDFPADPNADKYLKWNDTSGELEWADVGGGGVTDHGDLTGLSDNDHPQYALLDGTNQPFTGNLNVLKADPEIRLTDTGNSEYTRLVRADTNNAMYLYNRVARISAGTDLIPVMTSNTAPSGVASAKSFYITFDYFKAFDSSTATSWVTADGGASNTWLQYQFASATVANRLTYRVDRSATEAPRNFAILGSNDGTNWTTLSTLTSQTFTSGVAKTFDFTNTAAYTYYRVNISTNNGGSYTSCSNMELINTASTMYEIPIVSSVDTAEAGIDGNTTLSSPTAITNIDGIKTIFKTGGVEKFSIDTTGALVFPDNYATTFGTGKDATIKYDGTNLLINPQVVGSGTLNVLGGMAVDTNVLFVDATNDRVGIGTTTPTYQLHQKNTSVNTNLRTNIMHRMEASATGADVTMQWSDGVSNSAELSMKSGDFIISPTSAIGAVYIKKTTGNVGIGTTSPDRLLNIEGSSATGGVPGASLVGINLRNTNNGALPSRSVDISFSGSATPVDGRRYAVITGLVTGSDAAVGNTGAILFSTKTLVTDTTLTERMRINSAGNVGVGLTAPTEKLQVTGNIFLTNDNNKIYLGADKDEYLEYDPTLDGIQTAGKFKASSVDIAGDITHTETVADDFIINQTDQDKDVLVKINDGGTERTAIQIHGDEGSVSFPRQSCVCVYPANNLTVVKDTLTKVKFDTLFSGNIGNEFDLVNYEFVAKQDGLYYTSFSMLWRQNTTRIRGYIYVNGADKLYMQAQNINSFTTITNVGLLDIKKGDKINCWVDHNNTPDIELTGGIRTMLTIAKVS